MALNDFDIRPITPDELDAWWELRLRSLRDPPDAFGADYEETRRRGADYIRPATVEGGIDRLFGAFAPDGSLVAQARTVGNGGKRTHIPNVVSVYTAPDYRGLGLSKALIATVIAPCRAFPRVRQVGIGVNANNPAAIAVYTGAGFVAWGTEPRAIATIDGFHDEIHMVLMLDA